LYKHNLNFTAIINAVADWKLKKEASLHGGAEGSGQPQEEEEENIYAVAPEPDVRECYMSGILRIEY
jgi:predicted ATP-grasp superfamily ATP-dependent carboligase